MEANTPAKRQKPTTKKRQKSDPLATAGDGAFATVAVMNIDIIARRRPRRLVTLTAALVATSACTKPAPSPTAAPSCALSDFTITRFPLDGVNGRGFMINNYVDLDPSSPDVADFRGRTGARARTYDGHQGIDIDIPSFREMDDGRAVIHAVTAGVVEQVIDDQPDRNVTCAGRWNVVRVRHANGFAVLYGHIQRGSARVRPGQPIAPGTPLAIVGSAGCSTQPHLHLEVRDCAGRAVETLREAGVWRNPPLDEPSSAVMDVMLVDGDVPSVAQVKDPARDPTVIEPDGTLGVGLSLAARGGDLDRRHTGRARRRFFGSVHAARRPRRAPLRPLVPAVRAGDRRQPGALDDRDPHQRHPRRHARGHRGATARAARGRTPRPRGQFASAYVTAASNSARPSSVRFAAAVSRIAKPTRRAGATSPGIAAPAG